MLKDDCKPVELSLGSKALLEKRNYFHEGESEWKDIARRVAKALAAVEKEDIRAEWEEQFYELIATQKFIPSSPILMNADVENGGGLSSCFVIEIKDSVEGIFEAMRECAKIYQYNGGVGFDISTLRPAKAPLTTAKGYAGGPVAFLKNFNDVAESMTIYNSRKSATMICMQAWHPDIYEFIHCKDDGVSLSLMNISVSLSDEFMMAVANDDVWDLKFPDYVYDKVIYHNLWNGDLARWGDIEGRMVTYKTVRARDLFREIAESAWKRGDPGILFSDMLNMKNPNKHIDSVRSTNPCGEFNSIPYTSCCLGSFNLTKYDNLPYDIPERDVETAVRMLDNVITANAYPLDKIWMRTCGNRSIGIGVMGLADVLYSDKIRYGSAYAIHVTEKILKHISGIACAYSNHLAGIKGEYPNYPRSTWDEIHCSMRNSDVTSIAPTGFISTIAGVSSSVEPNFGLVYTRTTAEGDKFHVINKIFEEELRKRGLYSDDLIQKISDNHGSCQGIPEVPEDMRDVFVTAHDVTPFEHIAMTAAVQRNIDLSVSKTVNLPNSATVDDVMNIYQMAFEEGLIGVTVYRDGCRDNQVLTAGLPHIAATEPNIAGITTTRVRHDLSADDFLSWGTVIQCDDHVIGKKRKVRTACGNLHVLAFFDPSSGKILELYTNRGGQGGCTALQSSLSRLISRAFRLGDTPEAINDQLQSTLQCPNWTAANMRRIDAGELPLSKGFSCASAIGAAIMEMQKEINDELSDYDSLPDNDDGADYLAIDARQAQWEATDMKFKYNCPECGEPLSGDGGCLVCNSCGWSKCN